MSLITRKELEQKFQKNQKIYKIGIEFAKAMSDFNAREFVDNEWRIYYNYHFDFFKGYLNALKCFLEAVKAILDSMKLMDLKEIENTETNEVLITKLYMTEAEMVVQGIHLRDYHFYLVLN